MFDGCRNLVSQLVQHERIETTVPKVRGGATPLCCVVADLGFSVGFVQIILGF